MSYDPFTPVYDAIWAALDASPDFCAAVQPGNRIKMSGENPTPAKTARQDSDFPEVKIIPTTCGLGQRTSTGQGVRQNFMLELITGDLRIQMGLFPLKFIILQAILARGPYLGIRGLVNSVTITDLSELPDAKDSSGKAGWTMRMTIGVDIRLDRAVDLHSRT